MTPISLLRSIGGPVDTMLSRRDDRLGTLAISAWRHVGQSKCDVQRLLHCGGQAKGACEEEDIGGVRWVLIEGTLGQFAS